MRNLSRQVHAHPQLFAATMAGIAVGLLAPGLSRGSERVVVGWNAGAWLYLGLVAWMMWRADQGRLKRIAVQHAEGATVALGIIVFASLCTVGALVLELSAIKAEGLDGSWARLLLTVSTMACSWLMIPVIFALNYASRYYRRAEPGGLRFPTPEPDFEPDYSDFLYLSFAIAVAFQTSDVDITSRPMRRMVLVQGVLAFFFNSAILALAINAAGNLF